jgi:hypothetical protein
MGRIIGFIIGTVAGLWHSYFYIFPNNVLSLRLSIITTVDLLRILGGIGSALVAGIIVGEIGNAIGKILADRKADRIVEKEE